MLQERREWVLGWLFFSKAIKHQTERTEYPFFFYCIICLEDGLNSSLKPPETHTIFSLPDSYGCTTKDTPCFEASHLKPLHCLQFPIRAPPGSSLLLLDTWPPARSHFVPAFPLSQHSWMPKTASKNLAEFHSLVLLSQVQNKKQAFLKPQRECEAFWHFLTSPLLPPHCFNGSHSDDSVAWCSLQQQTHLSVFSSAFCWICLDIP